MSAAPDQRVLVWDAPVRVFHWLTVFSFVVAYVTADSERWRLVHVTLGYTLGALLVFRLVWGLVGTRYARFSAFLRGPSAVIRYLRSLASGRPEHHIGHNPVGAVAIVLMLVCGLALVLSGWAAYDEVAGEWVSQFHELAANGMLVLVVVHLVGVVSASVQHRENLVRAMLSGYKRGAPEQGACRSYWGLAAVILLLVLGFWWLQWRGAP
jgi:cytochrome b